MKSIAFSLLLIAPALTAIAQNNEGFVIYDQKTNMHRLIQDESIRAVTPEYRTTKMQLTVKGSESLYKAYENPDEDSETISNGNTVRMMFRMPQNETYRNFDSQSSVELRDLAGQKFLVEDTLRKLNWKLNPAVTKKINGYDCIQATATTTITTQSVRRTTTTTDGQPGGTTSTNSNPGPQTQKVVAWFTEAIPSPSGPGQYAGLPGLVLEVDIADGATIITASKIELRKVTEKELKVPSGGKKVTNQEFNKKREDYMKEMGASGGGGFRVIRN